MQPIAVVHSSLATLHCWQQVAQVTINRVFGCTKLKYRFRKEDCLYNVEVPLVGRLVGYRNDEQQQSSCTYVVTRVEAFQTGLNQGYPRFAFLKPVVALSETQVQYANVPNELRIQLCFSKGSTRWVENSPRNSKIGPTFTFDTIEPLDDGSYCYVDEEDNDNDGAETR